MAEPAEKFKDLDFLIGRIGMPVVMCGLLVWFLYSEWSTFKRDNAWKQEKILRNTRAVMQKLNIPVILDGELDGPKK